MDKLQSDIKRADSLNSQSQQSQTLQFDFVDIPLQTQHKTTGRTHLHTVFI